MGAAADVLRDAAVQYSWVGPPWRMVASWPGALSTSLDRSAADTRPPPPLPAAVGILGLQRAGAEALLVDGTAVAGDVAYKALGRVPSPAQRLAALHTLATLAGAERSGRSGKLLSPAAEDALRVAVFEGAVGVIGTGCEEAGCRLARYAGMTGRPHAASSSINRCNGLLAGQHCALPGRLPTTYPATPPAGAGAAWAGATPADVLRQQLDQPFLEQRVAVYRCLAALAARDWMAGQVCGHAGLLAFLCDPQSEASKQGCEWRHACVQQLAATIADVLGGGLGAGGPHQAVLAAAAQRVQAAERGGPYGAGAGPREQHVATVPGV